MLTWVSIELALVCFLFCVHLQLKKPNLEFELIKDSAFLLNTVPPLELLIFTHMRNNAEDQLVFFIHRKQENK